MSTGTTRKISGGTALIVVLLAVVHVAILLGNLNAFRRASFDASFSFGVARACMSAAEGEVGGGGSAGTGGCRRAVEINHLAPISGGARRELILLSGGAHRLIPLLAR